MGESKKCCWRWASPKNAAEDGRVQKVLLKMGESKKCCWRWASPKSAAEDGRVQKVLLKMGESKKCCWRWASLSPETCRADSNRPIKRSMNKIFCILWVACIVVKGWGISPADFSQLLETQSLLKNHECQPREEMRVWDEEIPLQAQSLIPQKLSPFRQIERLWPVKISLPLTTREALHCRGDHEAVHSRHYYGSRKLPLTIMFSC